MSDQLWLWHVCSEHRATHAPRLKAPGVDRPHIWRSPFGSDFIAVRLNGYWRSGHGATPLEAQRQLEGK
jgi:hypothetical protein